MQAITIKRFFSGHRAWTLLAIGLDSAIALAVVLALAVAQEESPTRVEPSGASIQTDRATWIQQQRSALSASGLDNTAGFDRADMIAGFRRSATTAALHSDVDRADAIQELRAALPHHSASSGLDRADMIARLRAGSSD